MNDKDRLVTVTVPASAARVAADWLFQGARDAGEAGLAGALERVAGELHAAGWGHLQGTR